jgi:predicted DsbA family dithiol-disulfide isomerase
MNDECERESDRRSNGRFRSSRRTFLAATSVTVGAIAGCADDEDGDDANVVDPQELDDDESDEPDENGDDETDETDEADEVNDSEEDDDEQGDDDEAVGAADDEEDADENGEDDEGQDEGDGNGDDADAADDDTESDADEPTDDGDDATDEDASDDSDGDDGGEPDDPDDGGQDEDEDDSDGDGEQDEEEEDDGEGEEDEDDEEGEEDDEEGEEDDEEGEEDDEEEEGGPDLDHPSTENMGHSPVLGPDPETADATIVMFDDPACPACAQFEADVFPDLQTHVDAGELSIVWRGMAVIEDWSDAALQVQWATYERDVDAFWDLREYAFEIQDDIDSGEDAIDRLIEYLEESTSIDTDAIRTEATDSAYSQRPALDEDAASRAGVDATPYFFLFREGEFRTEIRGIEDYRVFASALEL